MSTLGKTKSQGGMALEDYYASIEEALDENGPYSHNIISLCLRGIANTYGKNEANKTIDRFALTNLGWSKEK
jgi:hypothetical protein